MHQGKVRGFLLRTTQDYDLSNDIAQETFITAFNKISQFQGKNGLGGWLIKIAYNLFLQYQRSKTRRDEIHLEWKTHLALDEKIYGEMTSERIDLEIALSKINPDQAAAITLCHSFGFSHREAAEILNTPLGTLKTNILRGKKQLGELLASPDKQAKFG